MKRIAICADGTWNTPDQAVKNRDWRTSTNVATVARNIKPRSSAGIDQLVFYLEGVGTGNRLDRWTGGALGSGLEKNVLKIYRFLVYNYADGDELYFFGFSRGAFTVRTLAGFMNKVGLVRKIDDYYLPDLYAWYQSGRSRESREWHGAFGNIEHTRECPPIKFVGVWDTVGSLGPPGLLGQLFSRNKYKYHDIDLNSHIENAYHALAIDERRVPFAPSFWERTPAFNGQLLQAWFPGVHTNVGGSERPDGLANEALQWILEKAELLGLEFDPWSLRYQPCFNSQLKNSMTLKYRLLGVHIRPLGQHLEAGEVLHQAALDRENMAVLHYEPVNLRDRAAGMPIVNTRRVARDEPCLGGR